MSADNPVNIHLFLKGFKHLSNFCKILPFWVLNLMLKLFIKFTHQINIIFNYFFLIVIHILIIEKNLNCLLNLSMLLCFSWCRKNHICLKFYKFIIYSVIRTEFFISLLTTAVITSFSKMSFIIFSTFCITSAVLVSVFNSVMKRRDLKASLTLIWVKREASEGGKFRGKSSLSVRHCWSKCDYGF